MLSKMSLSVKEQPSKLHRFRYLKEIKDNRMGSVLRGGSSEKSQVKIRVTRREPQLSFDCRLKLIGCTVFEDLMTHPFYLYGDDCSDGVFQKEFTMSAGTAECDIALERIGIVCTPKKKALCVRRADKPQENKSDENKSDENKSDENKPGENKSAQLKSKAAEATIADNYQLRIAGWNLFNKAPRANPFQGKDVNRLKLAFQVFVLAPDSTDWVPADCAPVTTSIISDAKKYSALTVDYHIPKSVSRYDQDIWLHMKDPLPAESVQRFKVTVQDKKRVIEFPDLPVKSVKKHLVVFDFSSVVFPIGCDMSTEVCVVDVETRDTSNSVELQLSFPSEPDPKRRRFSDCEVEETLMTYLPGNPIGT